MTSSEQQAQALEKLQGVFGFNDYRPGQEEIVCSLLSKQPILAVMPTGAGKSLCYQLPALLFDRPTIVISPLIALMDDQVSALNETGVPAAAIHSGMDRNQQVDAWRAYVSGDLRLLYLSPERLMTERMLAAVTKSQPGMIVIDEAHCISKWGNDFRPEYEALAQLKDYLPNCLIAAFTATADKATRNDIAEKLFPDRGQIIVHGFDRPNLYLAVANKDGWKRQLKQFLSDKSGQSGIIYCLSRRFTDEVANHLLSEGHNAIPYHAGLTADQRKRAQDRFMSEEAVVMSATIAFGMGIDKADIRFVTHLNLPASMEAYYQEIGRAGRDGMAAETLLIFGYDDIRMRRVFIDEGEGADEYKRQEHKRLDSLLAYCETPQCRRQALLSYFDEESGPCGNCDNCLYPPTVKDGSTEASWLIDAIQDTGQMFGAAHIIDILRGAETQKVLERRHDQLPSHGLGSAHDKNFWQSFIRQAVAGGLLRINIQKYGCLEITHQGRDLQSGKTTFDYKEIAAKKSASKKKAATVAPSLDDIDQALFADLKRLRLDLAKKKRVPAYAVFPDRALQEMAEQRPTDLDGLAIINGVGPKKLAQYGEQFIARIQNFEPADF